MLEAAPAPAYGAVNVWDMYDVDDAREVPCGTAATFFYMLYSPSTNGLYVEGYNAGSGYADLVLYGPVTDDANGDLEIRENADEVFITKKANHGGSKPLTPAELDGVTSYKGFESNSCLKAKFRLYKGAVDRRFASEESRDGLIARIRELGVSGRPLESVCSIFGLRRVK